MAGPESELGTDSGGDEIRRGELVMHDVREELERLQDSVLVAVADAAARITGRRVPIEQAPWPDTAHPIDRRSFVAANARIASALGWRPSMTLDEGIRTLMVPRARQEHSTEPLKVNLGCGGRPLSGYEIGRAHV